ncbi:MAG: GTP-sensing pleiotropic transcriptional regulator CodY [Lachnospiraceae bacterium]|jgi:transcriptional pleiotropic repressor|nr:GTP-sensing pleiotropic transcriptional regulator CodY [Lachnospiraceae bacterium]
MNNNVVLLDKARKIGKLLHNNSTGKVVFNDICAVLADIMQSDIYIISRKGKVLGMAFADPGHTGPELITAGVGSFIDADLDERLLSILSTKENVNLAILGFDGSQIKDCSAFVAPIEIAGERLGTVFMYRHGGQYEIDDIILCEYGTTVVSLEMLRAVTEENEEESRKIAVVKSAISTLSYSEMEAIVHIFEELQGREGILVASKIADKEGITRSVIVNALRKFESAGVLESRSSGMKGTYIKVLNDAVYSEIDRIRQQLANNGKN